MSHRANKLECLPLGNFFETNLLIKIILVKEWNVGTSFICKSFIRIGCEGLTDKKALAYYGPLSVTRKSSLKTLAEGINALNLFLLCH
jgi:hypothetical protein